MTKQEAQIIIGLIDKQIGLNLDKEMDKIVNDLRKSVRTDAETSSEDLIRTVNRVYERLGVIEKDITLKLGGFEYAIGISKFNKDLNKKIDDLSFYTKDEIIIQNKEIKSSISDLNKNIDLQIENQNKIRQIELNKLNENHKNLTKLIKEVESLIPDYNEIKKDLLSYAKSIPTPRDGKDGKDGKDGIDGKDGQIPDHEVLGRMIRFKKPNGQWGQWVKSASSGGGSSGGFAVNNGGTIDAYTKTESDLLLADKANTSDVYNKSEVDTNINTAIDDLINGASNILDSFGEVESVLDVLQSSISANAQGIVDIQPITTTTHLDFGIIGTKYKLFTISDANLIGGKKVTNITYKPSNNKLAEIVKESIDDDEFDSIDFSIRNISSGSFQILAKSYGIINNYKTIQYTIQ